MPPTPSAATLSALADEAGALLDRLEAISPPGERDLVNDRIGFRADLAGHGLCTAIGNLRSAAFLVRSAGELPVIEPASDGGFNGFATGFAFQDACDAGGGDGGGGE